MGAFHEVFGEIRAVIEAWRLGRPGAVKGLFVWVGRLMELDSRRYREVVAPYLEASGAPSPLMVRLDSGVGCPAASIECGPGSYEGTYPSRRTRRSNAAAMPWYKKVEYKVTVEVEF